MAIMNSWVDQHGIDYVIFPKSEMKKHLNASGYRVDMAVKKNKRQELWRLSKIYSDSRKNKKINHRCLVIRILTDIIMIEKCKNPIM